MLVIVMLVIVMLESLVVDQVIKVHYNFKLICPQNSGQILMN